VPRERQVAEAATRRVVIEQNFETMKAGSLPEGWEIGDGTPAVAPVPAPDRYPPIVASKHVLRLEPGDYAFVMLGQPVAATQEENSGWAHEKTKPTPLVLFASSTTPQRHHVPAKSKPYGIDRKAARSHKVCPVRVFLGPTCAQDARRLRWKSMLDQPVAGRLEVELDTFTNERENGLLVVTLGAFDKADPKRRATSWHTGDVGAYVHWNRRYLWYYTEAETWQPFATRKRGAWERVRLVLDVSRGVFDCYGGKDGSEYLGGGLFRHRQKAALGIGLRHRGRGWPVYVDNLVVRVLED